MPQRTTGPRLPIRIAHDAGDDRAPRLLRDNGRPGRLDTLQDFALVIYQPGERRTTDHLTEGDAVPRVAALSEDSAPVPIREDRPVRIAAQLPVECLTNDRCLCLVDLFEVDVPAL